MLILVGIDTVNLEGKGITSEVVQGQYVTKGTVLGTFDKQVITAAGYPVTTMVVVTNSKSYEKVVHDKPFGSKVVPTDVVLTAVPEAAAENLIVAPV